MKQLYFIDKKNIWSILMIEIILQLRKLPMEENMD